MRNIWITFRKELRSIFRDKKTLLTLLVFPFLIPMIIFLYAEMYEAQSEGEDYKIGINYDVNTTEVSLLEESYLEVEKYDDVEDMKEAYEKGEILGYIDYRDDEKKYFVYTNEDSEDGMYVSSYVQAYLDGYQEYLAKLYLIGEDIDVDRAYDHFSYEIVDLDGDNWMLGLMFTMAFTYIVMAIVVSTTNMATTATAVEKENGTLETILTFPIRTRYLILGKYLATVFMGFLSSLSGLILTVGSLVIATNSYTIFEGISFQFSWGSIFMSLLIILLASLFIAGLSMALTSFAKSYKEAQSMSSVLNMITIVPMMVSLIGVEIEKWYYLIPIFNYSQVLMDIFSGNFDLVAIALVLISSVLYVILVVFYIIKRYHTEKVLF